MAQVKNSVNSLSENHQNFASSCVLLSARQHAHYLLTYLLTYSLTYSLHGAESFLSS